MELSQRVPNILITSKTISIGRLQQIPLNFFSSADNSSKLLKLNVIFSPYTKRVLEKMMVCLYHNEPCLLIGKAGSGKTFYAQYLANLFNKHLHVYNMHEGSDSVDLIGGFKSLSLKILLNKLLAKFFKLFSESLDVNKNQKFLANL